ncbi:MAG TPA: CRISPR-associated endonuclease Cas3'', partial [Ktedonobacterales bacterium]
MMRIDHMATTFAHSRNTLGIRQPLDEHLLQVAAQAKASAASFGAAGLAYYAGLLHDIGKYAPEWQHYLASSEAGLIPRGRGPDHKGAGACLAEALNLAPAALVMMIKGHHGGLPALGDMTGWLRERAADPAVRAAINTAQALYPALQAPPMVPLPERISS